MKLSVPERGLDTMEEPGDLIEGAPSAPATTQLSLPCATPDRSDPHPGQGMTHLSAAPATIDEQTLTQLPSVRDAAAEVGEPTPLACVLAGVSFPAQTWQLITHADYYGADSVTRAQLWRLPVGTYVDVAAVIATLAATTGHTRQDRPPAL